MTSFTLPIPTYQCHKRVQALKIKAVIENPRGYELHFEDERFCPVEFACNGVAFYPEAGRYLVLADGKPPICMDAAAFEAGYTLVETPFPKLDLAACIDSSYRAAIAAETEPLELIDEASPVGPATQAAREVGK